MSTPVTYTLIHPITFGSETITELKFRRPKGKDIRRIRDMGELTGDDNMNLIGQLCGKAPPVIDELDLEDITAIGALVDGFFKSGPKTGEEPTP